ncbi:helix-turn-helix domain-containing protein [Chryseobacterium sp. MMS23-Vi53]|uniref:helix-turn-helix domain-containing protein n=1 Tax=Chryseobacterium sp. MMS23-Vi53 TaxID=3386644 RepID=UPI0039EA472F
MQRTHPNYRLIYNDILALKHPSKREECRSILSKSEISILDVIKLNNIIFGINDKETNIFNQKHRSYDEKTILEILDYQEKNELNNTEVANHFMLSRNTVAKWKKHFKNRHLHSVEE